MLNKCLEFSGLFEIIRKMFECFRLKVGFLVVIALKKQKQIDDESADRDDPSSTFSSYVVKFHPIVPSNKIQYMLSIIVELWL